MQLAILIGVILSILLIPTKVNADAFNLEENESIKVTKVVLEPPQKPKPQKKKPHTYTIKRGDNLHKIAKENKTSWQRIWYKNKNLQHPDQLKPNKKIVIPKAKEKLKKRPIPALSRPVAQIPITNSNGSQASSSELRAQPANGHGNTYSYGYCTWGVKSWRPDIPNGLGNANTWYSRASAMGLPVGSTPRVGAVATTTAGGYGHVALVTAVNGNRVTVKEMNYKGWGVTSTRTTSASEFLYIY